MDIKSNILISITLAVVTFFVISCGSTAPLKERDAALRSIELAKSVEAEKYAPEEYGGAENDFGAGEKLIVREEKSGQNDDAKENYLNADTKAQDAYKKSIIPFTEEFIKRTDEEIESARTVKVDIARPDLFNKAVDKNQQARDLIGSENYDSARANSLEAYDAIKQAKEETLALKEEVDLLKREYVEQIDDLRDNKAEAAIPNEYGSTVDNFNGLEEKYQEGYYSDLLVAYPDGIVEARDHRFLIEEKRIIALEDLQKAESLLEEARRKTEEAEINNQ